MSGRTLKRLAVALAAVLVLWAVLALVRHAGSDRAVAFTLPRLDTAAVDTVRITRPGDTLVLARGARGAWTANGYPAASESVDQLLRGLADTLYWSELVAELRRSHPRFGVDSAGGRALEVRSRGRVLLDLVTGKQTTDYGGVYVRRANADPVYALHSPLGDAMIRTDDEWRDRHVARVLPESVAVVTIERAGRGYTLHRSGTTWAFASGAAADSSAVAGLLRQFRDLTATGFATKAEADSLDFRRPRGRARLLDAAGRPVAALAWDSTASGVWLRPDSGGVVFRTDAWTMNQLTPADSTLRPKTKR